MALLLIAATLAFFAIFAVWAKRQALDTDSWTRTSGELLEQPAIRREVSSFLVGRLYANLDLDAQLRGGLPPAARRLGGPAASGVRELAERATSEALAQPRARRLWEGANRRAHRQLVAALEGRANGVVRDEGVVVLDLRALLAEVADRVGVGRRAVARLPDDAARVTILRSDQLDFAQDVVRVLRALVVVLVALSLGLAAWAVAAARGWRREALRGVGLGLIGAGAAALVVRQLAGVEVVGALATTERVRPAADAAWAIGTSSLERAAVATIVYGALVVVGAWLAGPSRPAVSARAVLAPFLRDARLAYGALAVFVALLIVWGPTPATRSLLPALFLIAALAVGLELLRRQVGSELPRTTGPGTDRRGTGMPGGRGRGAEQRRVLDGERQVRPDRGAGR